MGSCLKARATEGTSRSDGSPESPKRNASKWCFGKPLATSKTTSPHSFSSSKAKAAWPPSGKKVAPKPHVEQTGPRERNATVGWIHKTVDADIASFFPKGLDNAVMVGKVATLLLVQGTSNLQCVCVCMCVCVWGCTSQWCLFLCCSNMSIRYQNLKKPWRWSAQWKQRYYKMFDTWATKTLTYRSCHGTISAKKNGGAIFFKHRIKDQKVAPVCPDSFAMQERSRLPFLLLLSAPHGRNLKQ